MSTPDRPRVSVIVPAFNAAAHLEIAIAKLLGQTLANIEIVIVDDGSTDATAQIAMRMAERDARVRFIQLASNGGVALARERAVLESRGDYLWFVDADDAWAENALDKLITAATTHDADVVVCGAQYVSAPHPSSGLAPYRGADQPPRPLPAPTLPTPISGRAAFLLLLEGAITGHLWNKLFRRELAIGIEFTPARVHSDLAMVAQLLAGARRVASIPDTLYSYLLRSGSIIRSGSGRAESLLLVERAVKRAASGLDPSILASPSYGYFRLRYILLSGIKDAVSGPYEVAERRELLRSLRSQLSWSLVFLPIRRRDWKRLALAGSAKASVPLHRLVVRLAAEQTTRS